MKQGGGAGQGDGGPRQSRRPRLEEGVRGDAGQGVVHSAADRGDGEADDRHDGTAARQRDCNLLLHVLADLSSTISTWGRRTSSFLGSSNYS